MTLAAVIDRVAAAAAPDLTFSVVLWDGTRRRYGPGGADAVVVHLRDRAACEAMLADPGLRFPAAYVDGALEVEGDLGRLMELLLRVPDAAVRAGLAARLALGLTRWRLRNTTRQARRNIASHYDAGNEFFRLWLDETMTYSCAYFGAPDEPLDAAQRAKLAHLCQKLRLEPGQTLLDVGCGWGGLAMHAAATHGVRVLGITLSEAQARYARAAVAARGLDGLVEIRVADYRDLDPGLRVDRVVSVGMFEHVGRARMRDYFAVTARLLTDGGVGVLHSIGRVAPAPTDPWISTHVFPGAYFPALGELADGLGRQGLHVTDVEALRRHYALTLDRWGDNLEEAGDAVRSRHGERFLRWWRFYLRSSAAAFRVGNLTVWQVQFTKGVSDAIPLTRDYLYPAAARVG